MMECSICKKRTEVYKALDGKAINLVILENNIYVYCVKCLRRDLLQRLNAKIHPLIKNGLNSAEMIKLGERELAKSKDFEELI